MEKKKVLFVGATLGGGGAERVMLNLFNCMREQGHEVAMVCTAARAINEYKMAENLPIEFLDSKCKNKVLKIIDKTIKIRKVFKRYPGYTLVSFFPDVNIYTVVASLGLKNRVVLSERNDPARVPGKKFLRILRDIAYEFCDGIVFQTHDAGKYFSKNIQKKGCVICNPINDDMPQPYEGEKESVVIAVGRTSPQKNYPMLIDAFKLFHDKCPEYTLEVYGRGKREKYNPQIASLGLQDCVHFYEHSQDIYERVRTCKIYASSSDYEGMSNTMLEAMALGTAAVVTDCPVGGAREVMVDHESGLMVPVGDAIAMAKAMEELATDDVLRAKVVKNALYVRQALSVEAITGKWLERI